MYAPKEVINPRVIFPEFTNLCTMINNGTLYSQAAQDSKMITMKVLGSQNDRVQRCLDLLKKCILQLPVVLQYTCRVLPLFFYCEKLSIERSCKIKLVKHSSLNETVVPQV